jgi:hypothetical protein
MTSERVSSITSGIQYYRGLYFALKITSPKTKAGMWKIIKDRKNNIRSKEREIED